MRDKQGRNAGVPWFERLERRELLSGNVLAVVSGGNLVLTGDASANAVVVTNPTPGSFHVAGTGGTTVNGAASADLAGVTGTTTVSLGTGGDTADFQNSTLPGSLTFIGGSGGSPGNTLSLESSTVNGSVSVFNSTGADTVTTTSATITGDVYIDGGSGYNPISMYYSSIGGSFTDYSAASQANLFLNGTTIGGFCYIYNGPGTSFSTLLNSSVGGSTYIYNVGGGNLGFAYAGLSTYLTINGGTFNGPITVLNVNGNDTMQLANSAVHSSFYMDNGPGTASSNIEYLTIDGSVTIVGLGGAQNMLLGNSGGATQFGSLLTVMGDSANTATLEWLTVTGAATVIGGNGGNTVSIDDSTFDGASYINTGSGNDTVNIARGGYYQQSLFVGRLSMQTGAGNDTVAIGNYPSVTREQARFEQSFSLDGGAGTDTLNFWPNFNILDGGVLPVVTNVETGATVTLAEIINVAAGQPTLTNASPINFTVLFNEPVTDFASGAVVLGGTAAPTTATITGSGTTYNVAVSGMTGGGTVTASVAAGTVYDSSADPNVASITTTGNTVTYDVTPPTVTIVLHGAQTDPTNTSTIYFDVQFSETVTDFATGDVTLGGTAGPTTALVYGSVGSFFIIAVTGMTGSGTVTAAINAGVAHDEAGNANLAAPSAASVGYDITPPTAALAPAPGQLNPTSVSPINFTVTFSEAVTGFTSSGVTLIGTAGATTVVVTDSGDGIHWNIAVSGMTGAGTVIVQVKSGAATDLAGNAMLVPSPIVTINFL